MQAATEQPKFDVNDLRQFTGTHHWYRHALVKRITYTDGVQYLAEKAGAYWLIDEIALAQMIPRVRQEEFQVWTLTRDDGDRSQGALFEAHSSAGGAVLLCTDGNDNQVFSKRIVYTDFPAPAITLYATNGVILLPSEN